MLPLLRCSRDGGPLLVEETRSSALGIVDAALRCGVCTAEYRIEKGVARLMDGALTAENEHEISLRDAEYASMPPAAFAPPDWGWRSELNDLIEVPPHLEALMPLENGTVLEIGCGDGRFTMLMAQLGARVLAVDFSIGALHKVARWLPSGLAPTTYRDSRCLSQDFRGRVGLVQAHAGRLHVAPRSFERALSATPLDCRDERMALYRTIAEALHDGGRFIGSVEHDDLFRRLLGLPSVRRYSPGGIFIEHFDQAKMRCEAAPYFSKLSIRPIRPKVPFIQRLPLQWGVRAASWVSATPGLRNLGELLLMRAEQPVRPPVERVSRHGSRLIQGLYGWYARMKGQLPVWGSEWVRQQPRRTRLTPHPGPEESSDSSPETQRYEPRLREW
jgi:SAM-dependent methyltransferase